MRWHGESVCSGSSFRYAVSSLGRKRLGAANDSLKGASDSAPG